MNIEWWIYGLVAHADVNNYYQLSPIGVIRIYDLITRVTRYQTAKQLIAGCSCDLLKNAYRNDRSRINYYYLHILLIDNDYGFTF